MTISVVEAGRRGGLTVLRTRGPEFYSRIGKKGQEAMRKKYPGMATKWGEKGGRPRKTTLPKLWGSEANNSKRRMRTRLKLASLPRQ